MLRFLVDASLPRPTAGLIRSLGHEATDVRDIGLRHAPDEIIARHARQGGLSLITRDHGFGDVRHYPPRDYAGIVVIHAPDRASRRLVLDMVRRFLGEQEVIGQLAGRLAIVEPMRVRVRSG